MTAVFSGLAAWFCHVSAGEAQKINTNQHYIEEIKGNSQLDISNPEAVLEFVLAGIPQRVTIYPTENYYYFSFAANHLIYTGNIRLDASDRDQGVVHFAYFPEYQLWKGNGEPFYRRFTAADGAVLEKLAPLSYRLSFRGKSVVFDINDLSNVRPPEGMLAGDETYIGPIYDESGMQFYLVFKPRLKMFLYILNESAPPPDAFYRAEHARRILIGRRTGFAYYEDKYINRKILIGVFAANSMLNNYFDGPFDQLPDNTLKGDELRQAVVSIDPSLNGKLDRFASQPDGNERFSINPYILYEAEDDLLYIERCVQKSGTSQNRYYRCFNAGMMNFGRGPTPGQLRGESPPRRKR